MRHPSSVGDSDARHYPTLDAAVFRRANARGIDLEASTDAFLAEVRVHPPPQLLEDLGYPPVVHHGLYGYKTGCACDVCRDAKSAENAQRYRSDREQAA